MSSRIEQAIDELESYIDCCKPAFMSNDKIIVNKETVDELIRELRMKTPDEIKRYQKIISNKEAILNDARERAEALVRDANIKTNELINEHEIMQQAYAHANEVVKMAQQQAQEILDTATTESNNIKLAAAQYMDDMLNGLDDVISDSYQAATLNMQNIQNSLERYKDIVKANKAELHPPVQEDVLDEDTSESTEDDSLDVI